MVSRSFGKMIEDYTTVSEAVATYTAMAAHKLRKQRSCAHYVLVFIDTNPYRNDLPQYSQNIVVNMPVATNSTQELLFYVHEGLKKIFQPNYRYKKAGVMMMDICPEDTVQGSLFDKVDRAKHKSLMNVLDKVNDRYGRGTLKFASMGDGKAWQIKQERLSRRFTTRLNELPVVN
jgi:DNA polymerase V